AASPRSPRFTTAAAPPFAAAASQDPAADSTARATGKRTSVPMAPPGTTAMGSTLLLSQSFHHEIPSDWSIDHPAWWSVVDGHLRARLPDRKQRRSLARFGADDWADVALQVDVCGVRGVDKGVVVRLHGDDGIGIDLRGDGYDDVLVYRGRTE